MKPYLLSATFILSALMVGCGGGAGNSNNTAQHQAHDDHSTMQSSPNAADAAFDLQFIDTMVVHHEGAIAMAKAVVDKAAHDELKTLAREIISSQTEEIAQMKRMRDERFAGQAPAVNMEMDGMRSSMKDMDTKKLAELKGNELDIEFIRQMIPHHTGALVMGNLVLQKSENNELKVFASNMLVAQGKEIEKMNKWRKDWAQ